MLVVAELLAAQEGLALPDRAGAAVPGRRHDVRHPARLRRHRPGERPAAALAAQLVGRRGPDRDATDQPRTSAPPPTSCRSAKVSVASVGPAPQRPAHRARRRRPPRRATASWSACVGASGCGKSTLLSIIGGLDQADDGRGPRRRRPRGRARAPTAAWCSRATRCSRGRSVADNIGFGLEVGALAEGAAARAGRGAARDHGAHRVRRRPARGALGRHAPARRHRPGARPRARRAAARRAVRRPRRRRPSAHLQDFLLDVWQRTRRHDPHGHPRRRGGVYLVEPHLRHVRPPRPHRRRDRRPVRPRRGPSVKRDPRFLDLADDLLDRIA